jgi:hypothetical protein
MGYIYLIKKQMKKNFYLSVFIFIFFLLSGCSLVRVLNYEVTDPENIFRPKTEDVLRRKINGEEIKLEANKNLYPVAIMIENAADSWPLSGLDKADLVIEAITEASITRFVAIYANDKDIEKIGPVRSARPYYLDWIEPFEPIYMHVGGSPDALRLLVSGQYDLVNLDQFLNNQYYWRDNKWRYAPHNVYTSSELIEQVLAHKELQEPADYQMWQYKKDKDLDDRPEQVKDITVLYTNDYYRVDWQYNREENNYIRYQYNDIQQMTDGEWIKAKNIIVQVNEMVVLDNVGRKRITTIGEGKAWVFRDGEIIEGKWIKEVKDERTIYYDNNNNEIIFNGGLTWIQVIPNEDYLRY